MEHFEYEETLHSWIVENARCKYFVDVGAFDGYCFSNTRRLEEEGWKGICIEPNTFFLDLKRNRKCIIDNRCVFNKTGEMVPFLQDNRYPLLSGIPQYFDKLHKRDGTVTQVETVTLLDLLKHWGAPAEIGYLCLDTEGSELTILEAFDFSFKFNCIHVEHNFEEPKRSKIRELLESKGYRYVREIDCDDWFSWIPTSASDVLKGILGA